MADKEKPDELQQAFADYVKMTNAPEERPQEGSARWKDLRGAFTAGARYGTEAMAAAVADSE